MTTPDERTKALTQTRELLRGLQSAVATPKLPSWLREEARRLLRHYPTDADLGWAHEAVPWLYGPVLLESRGRP